MTIKERRLLVAVILIAGAGWFGVREYRCKVRGAAFGLQVETIKRDAAKELRVGTNKAEVARFFAARNIPFAMLETEAFGTLRMSGCAPLGCGTDRAFIGVQVKFDAAGTVTEAPKVFGMYQDCL
jgi:hypothetical protein